MIVRKAVDGGLTEKATNDSIAGTVDTLFGIASLLTAAGLLAAGWATLRAGRWSGWRRLTPLACGLWSLALIGFVFTDVRMLAIAVYGLCFLALGIALFTSGAGWPRASSHSHLGAALEAAANLGRGWS